MDSSYKTKLLIFGLVIGVVASSGLSNSVSAQNVTMNENMSMKSNMTNSGISMQNMSTMQNPRMDTGNATISKVITRNYGTNDVYSLVFVKYTGTLHIDHIVVMQTNPSVQIIKAWIAKWDPQVSGNSLTFHSDKTSVIGGKTIVIQVITDTTPPSFTIGSVESHTGT